MPIQLLATTNKAYPTLEDEPRLDMAQNAGELLAHRLDRKRRNLRDCPTRIEFIRRSTPEDPPPSMMQILGRGGGRGGDVRLKLYLSLLWASPGGKHDTKFRAIDWAQILGLPKFSTNGKRRIYEALAWLDQHNYVNKTIHPGLPSVVTVCHESGNGTNYVVPSTNAATGGEPSYRKLQSAWWTNAWIAGLSGRALVFWLVLMDETGNGRKPGPVWLSEKQTKDKYGISPHLRQKALQELKHHELISTRRRMSIEPFGAKSSRTEITVHTDRLTAGLPSMSVNGTGLIVPSS